MNIKKVLDTERNRYIPENRQKREKRKLVHILSSIKE